MDELNQNIDKGQDKAKKLLAETESTADDLQGEKIYADKVNAFQDFVATLQIGPEAKRGLYSDVNQFFSEQIMPLIPFEKQNFIENAADFLQGQLSSQSASEERSEELLVKGTQLEDVVDQGIAKAQELEQQEIQRIQDLEKAAKEAREYFEMGAHSSGEVVMLKNQAEKTKDEWEKGNLLSEAEQLRKGADFQFAQSVEIFRNEIKKYEGEKTDFSGEFAVKLDAVKLALAHALVQLPDYQVQVPDSNDYDEKTKKIDEERAKLLLEVQRNEAYRGLLAGVAEVYEGNPKAFEDFKNFNLWVEAVGGDFAFKKYFFEVDDETRKGVMLRIQAKVAHERDKQGLEKETGYKRDYFEGKIALANGKIHAATIHLKKYYDVLVKDNSLPENEKKQLLGETKTLLTTIAVQKCLIIQGDISQLIGQRGERTFVSASDANIDAANGAMLKVLKVLNSGQALTFEEAWEKSGIKKELVTIGGGKMTTMDQALVPYEMILKATATDDPGERARMVASAVEKMDAYGGSTKVARRMLDEHLKDDLNGLVLDKETLTKLRMDAERDATKYGQDIKEKLQEEVKGMVKQVEKIDKKMRVVGVMSYEYRQLKASKEDLIKRLNESSEAVWAKEGDDNVAKLKASEWVNPKYVAARTGEALEDHYQRLVRKEKYLMLSKTLKDVDAEKLKMVEAAIDMDDLRDENGNFARDSINEGIDKGADIAFDVGTMVVGMGAGAVVKLAASKVLARLVAKGGVQASLARGTIWASQHIGEGFGSHASNSTMQAMGMMMRGESGADAFDDFAAGWGQSALLFASISGGGELVGGVFGGGKLFGKQFEGVKVTTKTGEKVAIGEAKFAELGRAGQAKSLAYQGGQMVTEMAMNNVSETAADALDHLFTGSPMSRQNALDNWQANLENMVKFRIGAKLWKSTRVGKELYAAEDRVTDKANRNVARAKAEAEARAAYRNGGVDEASIVVPKETEVGETDLEDGDDETAKITDMHRDGKLTFSRQDDIDSGQLKGKVKAVLKRAGIGVMTRNKKAKFVEFLNSEASINQPINVKINPDGTVGVVVDGNSRMVAAKELGISPEDIPVKCSDFPDNGGKANTTLAEVIARAKGEAKKSKVDASRDAKGVDTPRESKGVVDTPKEKPSVLAKILEFIRPKEKAKAAEALTALAKAKIASGNNVEMFNVFVDVAKNKGSDGVSALMMAKDVCGDNLEMLRIFAETIKDQGPEVVWTLMTAKDVYGSDVEMLRVFAGLLKYKGPEAGSSLVKAKKVSGDNVEMFNVFFDLARDQSPEAVLSLVTAKEISGDNVEMFNVFAEVAKDLGPDGVWALVRAKEVSGDNVEMFNVFAEVAKDLGPEALRALVDAQNAYGDSHERLKAFVDGQFGRILDSIKLKEEVKVVEPLTAEEKAAEEYAKGVADDYEDVKDSGQLKDHQSTISQLMMMKYKDVIFAPGARLDMNDGMDHEITGVSFEYGVIGQMYVKLTFTNSDIGEWRVTANDAQELLKDGWIKPPSKEGEAILQRIKDVIDYSRVSASKQPYFSPEGNTEADLKAKMEKVREIDPRTDKPYEMTPISIPEGATKKEKVAIRKANKDKIKENHEKIRAGIKFIAEQYKEQAKIIRGCAEKVDQYLEKNPNPNYLELRSLVLTPEIRHKLSSDQVKKIDQALAGLSQRVAMVGEWYPKLQASPVRALEEMLGLKKGFLQGPIKIRRDKGVIQLEVTNISDYAKLYGGSQVEARKTGGFAFGKVGDKDPRSILTVSRTAGSESVDTHERQHQNNKLLFEDFLSGKENNPLLRAQDEVIAYLKDGTSPEDIVKILTKEGDLYDYYKENRKAATTPAEKAAVDKQWESHKKQVKRMLEVASRVLDAGGKIDVDLLSVTSPAEWKLFAEGKKGKVEIPDGGRVEEGEEVEDVAHAARRADVPERVRPALEFKDDGAKSNKQSEEMLEAAMVGDSRVELAGEKTRVDAGPGALFVDSFDALRPQKPVGGRQLESPVLKAVEALPKERQTPLEEVTPDLVEQNRSLPDEDGGETRRVVFEASLRNAGLLSDGESLKAEDWEVIWQAYQKAQEGESMSEDARKLIVKHIRSISSDGSDRAYQFNEIVGHAKERGFLAPKVADYEELSLADVEVEGGSEGAEIEVSPSQIEVEGANRKNPPEAPIKQVEFTEVMGDQEKLLAITDVLGEKEAAVVFGNAVKFLEGKEPQSMATDQTTLTAVEMLRGLKERDPVAYELMRSSDIGKLVGREVLNGMFRGDKLEFTNEKGEKVVCYRGKFINQGGFGVVTKVGYVVAGETSMHFAVVKEIRNDFKPEEYAQFSEEAFLKRVNEILAEEKESQKLITDWGHPNIIKALQVGDKAIIYESSNDAVNFRMGMRKMPMRERFQAIKDIIPAIKFLHNQGYFHGDLKPDNILLMTGEDGLKRAKVIDLTPVKLSNGLTIYPKTKGYCLPDKMLVDAALKKSAPPEVIGRANDTYAIAVMIEQQLKSIPETFVATNPTIQKLNKLVEDVLSDPFVAGNPKTLDDLQKGIGDLVTSSG